MGHNPVMAIPGDNPIEDADDDALFRAPVAEAFATQILELDTTNGLVAGVLGPWGSGKTTFVNLSRGTLEQNSAAVIDFNPWMFSGAEQLVDSFFIELSSQLRMRPGLEAVGEDLADYGEAFSGLGWLPVVGPWIERGRGTAKILGKYLKRRSEGTGGRRDKLKDELRKLEKPIVVVLDDIDRLSTSEIRDVFKLVRLTASFPNVIYIVAFDRKRVEKALEEDGIPGRDYLEKILQVAVDLPVVPQEALLREILKALSQAIEGADVAEIDQEVWPDVLMEIVRPLVKNLRDVRRYAAAVHTSMAMLGRRIALADLLAMEAIRVFLPDTYAEIQVSVDALCTPRDSFGLGGHESSERKEAIERLLKDAGEHEQVVRALIRRLFPFARRHIENNNYGPDWQDTFLRERRVAHEAVLSFYLERVAGKKLLVLDYTEEAWERMSDQQALEDFFQTVPPDRQEDVVAGLEAFEGDFRLEHAVGAVPVLLNLVGGLPERPRGMLDMDSKMVVSRVVYRLLRPLDGPEVVAEVVRQVMPTIQSLSAKMLLLTIVGYRKNAGHKLVSEEIAATLEANWRDEVRDANAEELSREFDLTLVLYRCRRDALENEDSVVIPDDPEVTYQLLRSARSEIRGQTADSRAVRRTPVFAWSTLVELFGEESVLISRVEQMRDSGVVDDGDLLELAEKYLGGWRPRDFGEDVEGDE